jgi:hypothetical protein
MSAGLCTLTVKSQSNENYCLFDGDEDFTDIAEFSSHPPDEPVIINSFDSVDDALN